MESFIFVLKSIVGIILGLSVLVVIHELGHFLPARWFGMKVEKFYLFFDWPRKLFSFTRGGVEYGVGMLPFGGYVKITGIVDESMDNDHVNEPPQPHEFRSKPVWQRIIVMIGGVTMNIILGVLIFIAIMFFYGEEHIPMNEVKNGIYVPETSVAKLMGLQTGDKIISFNGKSVEYFDDVSTPAVLLGENSCYDIERNGEKSTICAPDSLLNRLAGQKKNHGPLFSVRTKSIFDTIPLSKKQSDSILTKYTLSDGSKLKKGDQFISVNGDNVEYFDQLYHVLQKVKGKPIDVLIKRGNDTLGFKSTLDTSGRLGVGIAQGFKTKYVGYSLIDAVVPGTEKAFGVLMSNIRGLGKIFTGKVDAQKGLGGPVAIATTYAKAFDNAGMLGFWSLTGMLSMWLAFLNILPIPALDGGHIVLLLVEAVIGRAPSPQLTMRIQQVGMVFLIGLMVLVFFNDIFKAFMG